MYLTPKVEEVRALSSNFIYVKFADGKEKVYDMTELIEKIKFYEKLKNREYFKLVVPRGITVEWPNGEDVCPEDLYNDSVDFSCWNEK